MTIEELEEKRIFSLKVVFTLGIYAYPEEFWLLDTNLFKGTSLDKGLLGLMLRIFSFLLLTVPFLAVAFIIHLFKIIYYSVEINRFRNKQEV